jgi:hypothetical protein
MLLSLASAPRGPDRARAQKVRSLEVEVGVVEGRNLLFPSSPPLCFPRPWLALGRASLHRTRGTGESWSPGPLLRTSSKHRRQGLGQPAAKPARASMDAQGSGLTEGQPVLEICELQRNGRLFVPPEKGCGPTEGWGEEGIGASRNWPRTTPAASTR